MSTIPLFTHVYHSPCNFCLALFGSSIHGLDLWSTLLSLSVLLLFSSHVNSWFIKFMFFWKKFPTHLSTNREDVSFFFFLLVYVFFQNKVFPSLICLSFLPALNHSFLPYYPPSFFLPSCLQHIYKRGRHLCFNLICAQPGQLWPRPQPSICADILWTNFTWHALSFKMCINTWVFNRKRAQPGHWWMELSSVLPLHNFFKHSVPEFTQPSVCTSSICLNNRGCQVITPVHLCVLDPCFSKDRHPWTMSFITAYPSTTQNQKGKEI